MDTKRQLQVGEVIKRNFSSVLQSIGSYIYGNILVSVTSVKMAPDLSQAKIYLSIYGTEDKNEVVDMMELHNTQLKQELVSRIRKQLRRMPQINFYLDDTIDEIYKVDELFSKIEYSREEE